MSLPIIDIAPLLPSSSSPPAAVADAVAAVAAACVKPGLGFFYATGHGIPPSVTDAAFDALDALFSASQQVKASVDARSSGLRRGYTAAGSLGHTCAPPTAGGVEQQKEEEAAEAGAAAAGGDVKESFTVGMERRGAAPATNSPLHGPNQWPDERVLPGFRAAVSAYMDAGLAAARGVARGLAPALGLAPDALVATLDAPVAQCVLLRYPPVGGAAVGGGAASASTACGAHTDCGLVTLITQRGRGLQVRPPGGAWTDVPPVAGSLVVNLGDLAEFWSGGKVASTLHRVLPPPAGARARDSIALFSNAAYDAPVVPAGEGGGEATTAGAYVLGKLGLMWMAEKEGGK